MTTNPSIHSLNCLWNATASYARLIRAEDEDRLDWLAEFGRNFDRRLCECGLDTDDEADAEFVGIRDSRADEETIAYALRDLAIRRIPLADRMQWFLDRRVPTRVRRWTWNGGDAFPWRLVGLMVLLGLDLAPDDVLGEDWPTAWSDGLPSHHLTMFRDTVAGLDRRIHDLAGALLGVHASLSGDIDHRVVLECPTEAEADALLASRDLIAADSLVAIPARHGDGSGPFIVVDFETRTAFTPADLDRCRGVS